MEFLPLIFFALAVACLIGAIVVTVVPEQRAHQLLLERERAAMRTAATPTTTRAARSSMSAIRSERRWSC